MMEKRYECEMLSGKFTFVAAAAITLAIIAWVLVFQAIDLSGIMIALAITALGCATTALAVKYNYQAKEDL